MLYTLNAKIQMLALLLNEWIFPEKQLSFEWLYYNMDRMLGAQIYFDNKTFFPFSYNRCQTPKKLTLKCQYAPYLKKV